MDGIDLTTWLVAAAITLLAGFVKGVVGFAMPLIMVSGLASILPVELALAALILPTLLSNLLQTLRDGPRAALASASGFKLYIAVVLVAIFASAPLVKVLPQPVLLATLGIVTLAFIAFQVAGWRLRVGPGERRVTEVSLGLGAGLVGGVSGVWGPPTVMLLTALEVPKREHVRIQGAVYTLSSVALAFAHVRSGVFNATSATFSAAMVVPALIGMALGLLVQDRLDAERFRKVTLVVLALTGLNLVRRGLF